MYENREQDHGCCRKDGGYSGDDDCISLPDGYAPESLLHYRIDVGCRLPQLRIQQFIYSVLILSHNQTVFIYMSQEGLKIPI